MLFTSLPSWISFVWSIYTYPLLWTATLPWWRGLCVSMILRTQPVEACEPLAGTTKPERSKGRNQTKRQSKFLLCTSAEIRYILLPQWIWSVVLSTTTMHALNINVKVDLKFIWSRDWLAREDWRTRYEMFE